MSDRIGLFDMLRLRALHRILGSVAMEGGAARVDDYRAAEAVIVGELPVEPQRATYSHDVGVLVEAEAGLFDGTEFGKPAVDHEVFRRHERMSVTGADDLERVDLLPERDRGKHCQGKEDRPHGRSLLLAAMLGLSALFAIPAQALEIGYGIAHPASTEPVPSSDSGLELRALWGGPDGDRWSAWLGRQGERHTREGYAFSAYVDTMPGYSYAAVLRRFNARPFENITLFAGTGIGYRDLETCQLWDARDQGGGNCMPGDPFVSSRWAFAEELGFRWKIVEISVGHFSTGGISEFNKGLNLVRFSLLWPIGGRRE